jgi:8-oxo-dGTP pyrophosphatase MutT (NUDIX family)
MANGIHGAFTILQINGKFAFIKREKDGLWDIPGGGFEITEIDYRKVAARELWEEMRIRCKKEHLNVCATLGQKLKAVDVERYGGVTHGYVFLHFLIIYKESSVRLSREHTEYKLFTYEEVIRDYKQFKSGPLWLFFTFLEYQRTNKLQEGLVFDRRFWQEIEYYEPL